MSVGAKDGNQWFLQSFVVRLGAWAVAFAALSCGGPEPGEGDPGGVLQLSQPICGSVGIVANPPSPEPPGSIVTITGSASCTGVESPQFRFLYRAGTTGSFTVFRNWDAAPSADWNTTGLAPNQYQVRVETRADSHAGPAQAFATSSYVVGGLCRNLSLSPNYVWPRPLAPFTLTADATCEDGTPEYRFLYLAPGASTFSEFRGWGGPSATFDLTGLASGVYAFRVHTRAIGSPLSQQATGTGSYQFGDVCNRVSIGTAPGSPQPAGTNVNLTGSATCVGSTPPEYTFIYRPTGTSSWTVIRSWGGANAVWNTAGLPEGGYELRVQARAQGNASSYESYRALGYTLGPACPAGFEPDGSGGCADIDECAADNGGCDPLTTCTNTIGSRVCGACPAGYTGDGESGCVLSGPIWIQASPETSPIARWANGLVYDGARENVVLFGGIGRIGGVLTRLSDTWTWDGTDWTEQSPASSPPARTGPLAYDPTRERVVMFGGAGESGLLGDTWEWDGANWSERTPAIGPRARFSHAMTFDSTRGRVVVFGGAFGSFTTQSLNDTWEWDGTTWIERTPSSRPPIGASHAMAYDTARGRAVLFGGHGAMGGPHNDTWEWDGTNWMQRLPAHRPPPRDQSAMAYDSARQRIVLFGGFFDGNRLGDTWEWDGTDWTEVFPTTNATGREEHDMTYDAGRNRIVVFGGLLDGASAGDDTWEFLAP
jgi:hypothetical protein